MSPSPRLARSLAALLAVVAPLAAGGQEVRGRTLDATGAAAVPGVIVMLVDSAMNVVARTLSGRQGDFRLVAAHDGAYRLRALRIGFRPTVSEPVALRAGTVVTQVLALTGGAVRLAETRVTGEPVCPTRDARQESALDAWTEARKALEASLLTRAEGYAMEVVRFERRTDPRGGRVLNEFEREYRGPLDRPFASAPMERLDSLGYVTGDAAGTSYFGPDEQVLLSPRFAETHCLQMVPSASPDESTIAFEPVKDRLKPDISGTLTLARATGALRRLEFRYVNVPFEVRRAEAGGTIAFQPLATGGWIVQRWALRMPELAEAGTLREQRPFAVPRPGESAKDIVVTAFRLTGGEVEEVVQHDSVVWSLPRPRAEGVVRDVDGRPVARARVTLPTIGRAAMADSAGRFTFAALRPARRSAVVATGLSDSLGLPAFVRELDTREAGEVALLLPRREDILASLCADSVGQVTGAVGLLRGHLEDERGERVKGVDVEATWASSLSALGAEAAALQARVVAHADADGDFAFCGVPVDRPLRLHAGAPGGRSADVLVSVPGAAHVALTTLVLRPPREARVGARGEARLHGIVTSDSAAGRPPRPLAGIELRLFDDGAVATASPLATTRSDSAGRFAFAGVVPRAYRLETRRLGYAPQSRRVEVGPDTARVVIRLGPAAQVLDATVTTAERTYRREILERNGFVERRTRWPGQFLDADDIGKTGRIMLYDAVRQWRRSCMQVYVNGAAAPFPRNLSVTEVVGVEIYRRTIDAPPQYTNSARADCGSIVIWLDPYREAKR